MPEGIGYGHFGNPFGQMLGVSMPGPMNMYGPSLGPNLGLGGGMNLAGGVYGPASRTVPRGPSFGGGPMRPPPMMGGPGPGPTFGGQMPPGRGPSVRPDAMPGGSVRDQWGRLVPTGLQGSPLGGSYTPQQDTERGNALNPWARSFEAQSLLGSSPWTNYFNRMAGSGIPQWSGLDANQQRNRANAFGGIGERLNAYRQLIAQQAAERQAADAAGRREDDTNTGRGAAVGGLGAVAAGAPFAPAVAAGAAIGRWNPFGWW